MTQTNPIQVQKHLKGIDYPVGKQDLLKHAKQNGADADMCARLEQLPDEEYDSPTAVSKAIGELE